MKNIYKIFGLAAVLIFTATSCTEEDNTVNQVFDGKTSGAVLRTIALISNELPVGPDGPVEGAQFSVELEEQDDQEGDLLESVDVYVTFTDGSPDEGDSTGATTDEVFLRTIQASDFSDGPFGLPRYTLTITVEEYISAVNLSGPEAVFGGDNFNTRLSLNLTDGRVFSIDNAGGIITGGFFASPFQYNTPVVCPVEDMSFTGEYISEQITPTIFGYDTFDPDGDGIHPLTLYQKDQVVDEDGNANGTVVQGADAEAMTSTQRVFDAFYIAILGFDNEATFVLDFICGEVTFSGSQDTGLTCSGGSITLGPPNGAPGVYDFADDSFFNLVFVDDEIDDCGQGAPDVEINFTKE